MAERNARESLPPDIFPPFSPSILRLLERVVEEAWADMQKSHKLIGTTEDEELAREVMMHRVMARAARGELDPERLKQHAGWGLPYLRRR